LPLSAEEKVLAEGDVTNFLNSKTIEFIEKDEEKEMDAFDTNTEIGPTTTVSENKSSSMAISESQNSQIAIYEDVPVKENQEIQSFPFLILCEIFHLF
jgi:hypothetical protein